MLSVVGSFAKARVQNFVYLWRVRPAIKWMIVGTFLRAIYAGFIFEPFILVMKDLDKHLLPVFLLMRECSMMLGGLLYALASLKWKLPHKRVLCISAIFLLMITPLYSVSSPELVLLFSSITGLIDGSYVVAQATLFRCFLPLKAADHIGFTWIDVVAWQITFAIARIGGLAFLEQGYPLFLWGMIGSLFALACVVPIIIACRVQQPMEDFQSERSYSSTSTIPAGLVFWYVLCGMGAIHVILALYRVAPLLHYSPTEVGVLQFGATMGFLIGGILATLLPSRRVSKAIRIANWSVIGSAAACYLTDNRFVLLVCFFLTGVTIVLLNQIVGQRLFANLQNKVVATALPILVGYMLSMIGSSGYVVIGNNYGFDIAYACVLPLGVLALVSFRWLAPLLTDKTTK
jgi:hypothetical protein